MDDFSQESDDELEYLRSKGNNEIVANTAASRPNTSSSFVSGAHKVQQFFTEDGKAKTLIRATKTKWISSLIHLDGKHFNFDGRDYLQQIYNAKRRKRLLICGRQVEKSTMLANEIIINSVVKSFYKTLYVSPSHSQTRQFSNGKLKPWIEGSPVIAKYLVSSQTSAQVFEKGLANGSICFLRSAFLSADRARGISADLLCLDEIQDLLTSNIPVIEECLSHAPEPMEIMSGTPKTLENPIEERWQESSMCEWLVPCTAHIPQHWNYLDERSIGKFGPICNKCGGPIDPSKGKWIAFNRDRDLDGFRIPQIIVPWIYRHPEKWKELVWKKENYGKGQLYNECLGISYDSASKPVTRADLVACCSSSHPYRPHPDKWTRRVELFAGIDWGEGTDGTERGIKGKMKDASYTVLAIGMYITPTVFHYIYYKRFTGKEAHPNFCVDEVIDTLRRFGIRCTGVDWGHGWGVNSRLIDAFGANKVIPFQYVGNQRERKKWDDVGMKYQLARTEVMADFFESIRKQEIVWPAWEHVKDYLVDIEHVFAEYNESSKTMKYDHKKSEPDDACHASILCREAADNYYGKAR